MMSDRADRILGRGLGATNAQPDGDMSSLHHEFTTRDQEDRPLCRTHFHFSVTMSPFAMPELQNVLRALPADQWETRPLT